MTDSAEKLRQNNQRTDSFSLKDLLEPLDLGPKLQFFGLKTKKQIEVEEIVDMMKTVFKGMPIPNHFSLNCRSILQEVIQDHEEGTKE